MNEKFFDLSKEKQDRIINAVLKIFTLEGYSHAATDDMVKEAGISKGLLFHYFGTKLGAYRFVCSYVLRYLRFELGEELPTGFDTPVELTGAVLKGCSNLLRTYPYSLLFLRSCVREENEEALTATAEERASAAEIIASMRRKALVYEGDVTRLWKSMDYTLMGLMEDHLRAGEFNAERYLTEAGSYLEVFAKN
jgi:AcrR family transcriptional regulator